MTRQNFWDTPGFTKKLSAEQLAEKRVSELKNGRLAMMAITGMAVQEFVYGTPVIAQTPFFFGR